MFPCFYCCGQWGFVLGVGIFASTYTWYFSLDQTSVAGMSHIGVLMTYHVNTMSGNSAVYQSAPVFVFLLSIPLLNEKVCNWKYVHSADNFNIANGPQSIGCSSVLWWICTRRLSWVC